MPSARPRAGVVSQEGPQSSEQLASQEGARSREQLASSLAHAPAAILALQRTAGNQAVVGMLQRTNAFTLAASGTPAPLPRRAQMEAAFATRFDEVRAHLGGAPARAGLAALGARAAARGSEIVFRDPDPPADLVAHELAHVMQQRRGAAGVACRRDGDSGRSGAERAAAQAAAEVAAGRPAPDVGVAAAGDVQLASVQTAGGEWKTKEYEAVRKGMEVGAHMTLEFNATEPVVADKIGLVQTVKTEKSNAAGAMEPSFKDHHYRALATPERGKPEAAIDQRQDTGLHTNPLYVDESGTESKSLAHGTETSAFGQLGWRIERPPSGVEVKPAILIDKPHTGFESREQIIKQRFEVAALALDGPFTDVYLGSIAWGLTKDAGQWGPRLDPPQIEVVGEGSPSGAFAAAAQRWNDYTLSDRHFDSGGPYETVDLPIAQDEAGTLGTEMLGARLVALRNDTAATTGPKQLQIKAFERELMKRHLRVAVTVADAFIGGENVFITVTGGKSPHRAPGQRIGDSETGSFLVPMRVLADAVPFAGMLLVDVSKIDANGNPVRVATATWPGAGQADAAGTANGVTYSVVVAYER